MEFEIKVVNNLPVISSLNIANEFGIEHKSVLRNIRKVLGEHEFVPSSYTNSQNKQQPMIYLDEQSALIAMPFIGGEKSQEGQRALVKAYLAYKNRKLSPAEELIAVGQNMLRLEREQTRIEEEQKLLNRRQDKVESEMAALSGQLEQMSVKAYCNLEGIRVSNQEANSFGRKAAKYSKEKGHTIGKVTDPVYGKINAYDQEVLDKVVKH